MFDLSPRCSVWAKLAAACFTLFLLSSPADAAAQGTSVLTLLSTEGRELEIGDEVGGALSASDFVTANENYVEAWALEGEPGQEVWIDLVSDDFDSYLYVVGPGFGETLTDDDSGGACHARINFTFLDRGVFRVVASSTSGRQSGTYRLRVSRDPRPAAEMSCGGVDGSALPPRGDLCLMYPPGALFGQSRRPPALRSSSCHCPPMQGRRERRYSPSSAPMDGNWRSVTRSEARFLRRTSSRRMRTM